MGKRWAKRWTTSGKDHRRNKIHALRVLPSLQKESLEWILPPSKSHLIRALLLAGQSPSPVDLEQVKNAGEDARAMRRCLQQLGVLIEDFDQDGQQISQTNPVNFEHHPQSTKWRVHGVGGGGFSRPASVLNAANSGTTLRLLGTHAGLIGGPIMLDGDLSLRRRSSDELWSSIEQSGVTLSVGMGQERLPALLDGPMREESLSEGIDLDISRSSQPLSSWILASPSLPCLTKINLIGDAVSSRHYALSLSLLEMFGGSEKHTEGHIELEPQVLSPPDSFKIPGDASMAAFALLMCACSKRSVILNGWPAMEDAIGHEVLQSSAQELGIDWSEQVLTCNAEEKKVDLDLSSANDLLPPLAALLAIGGGGVLRGAAHAAYKESNRLTKTCELLAQFGLKVTVENDGLSIQGHQHIVQPSAPIETFGDHRLFMTAVVLASTCGGDVVGQNLHLVADEGFLERLRNAGVQIEQIALASTKD